MDDKKTRPATIHKQDNIDWGELIQVSLRNWKWFVLSAILCVSLGIGYILVKVPVYHVSAQVLLKDKDNKMSSPALSMLANLGALGGGLSSMTKGNNLDNEIGIMGTKVVTKQAVYDLGLHIVCTTKNGLKTIDMYPDFPYLITVDSLQVDTMLSSIRFKIVPEKNDQFLVKGKHGSKKFQTTITSFPAVVKTPFIDINIDRNPLVPLEKEDQVVKVEINNPNITTHNIRKLLGIEATSKRTTIIGLGMEADNVPKAQDLINQIISIYNYKSSVDQNEDIKYTAAFINERLDQTMSELVAIEKEVENYKLQNNLTSPEIDAKISLEKISEYEAKQIEFRIQQNMIRYLIEYINDDKNKNELIPSVGVEDKGLLASVVPYNELLTERNGIERTSSINNPSLFALNQQLTSMRQNILANFRNVDESLSVALRDLDKQYNSLDNRIKLLPRHEREYVELAREQTIYEQMYVFLLQKKEEAIFNLAAIAPKVKIIDPAMPNIKPAAPRKLRVLAMMLLLGLGVPFIFIYLKQRLKDKS